MTTLADVFHDAATFVALEPEDAAAVLMGIAQQKRAPSQSETGWPIFLCPAIPYPTHGSGESPAWPRSMEHDVRGVYAEAVGWLTREGLVMEAVSGSNASSGKLVFTRRGLQMRTRVDMAQCQEASALPIALVHNAIAERVIPQFLRGDRDSAVSYGFREVEIAVRFAAKFDDAKHGMAMMRDAFNPKNGPLRDHVLPAGEQEAEQSLFAGALGHGPNPVSHREVDMTPIEAARLILLASHLLSIVEKRIAAKRLSNPSLSIDT